MNEKANTTSDKEVLFREKAKNYAVCFSAECPLREHCLHSILKDYVPREHPVVTCINLRNPKTQGPDCQSYKDDKLFHMPLGLSMMYYDMPGRLERAIKNHLICLFTRKRYYQFHGGRRPILPAEEQIIRQTLLEFGWTKEPVFNSYTDEYIW